MFSKSGISQFRIFLSSRRLYPSALLAITRSRPAGYGWLFHRYLPDGPGPQRRSSSGFWSLGAPGILPPLSFSSHTTSRLQSLPDSTSAASASSITGVTLREGELWRGGGVTLRKGGLWWGGDFRRATGERLRLLLLLLVGADLDRGGNRGLGMNSDAPMEACSP